MTGFEPAAPSSRTKCATKLRYIPFRFLSIPTLGNLLAADALQSRGRGLGCPTNPANYPDGDRQMPYFATWGDLSA